MALNHAFFFSKYAIFVFPPLLLLQVWTGNQKVAGSVPERNKPWAYTAHVTVTKVSQVTELRIDVQEGKQINV